MSETMPAADAKCAAPPMYAFRCEACGEIHYPRHYVCKTCGSQDFDEVVLDGACLLETWTRVFNLPEGYMKPSLCFGMVRFPNGLVVAGQLDVEEPRIGMELQTSVGVIKEGIGQDNYGFIFIENNMKE
ncbi:MAG: zinc ribbon domain-containing protein [Coriobacteriales bacterium]|nr:zinc ribbon domain-containing protein [Coriobacteriales bacterium]